jgi:hypothetical protein
MINILDLVKAIINTLIRLSPIAFYTGSVISGAIFSDFRAALLLGGFLLNEFLSMGYRMIFHGDTNPQCALLLSTNETPFVLPSPISQTVGFLYGFILADMYYNDVFNAFKFFMMTALVILTIYSRINVGCKTILDAVYCSLVGTMLGVVYYSFIKDYYRADYFSIVAGPSSNIDSKIAGIL